MVARLLFMIIMAHVTISPESPKKNTPLQKAQTLSQGGAKKRNCLGMGAGLTSITIPDNSADQPVQRKLLTGKKTELENAGQPGQPFDFISNLSRFKGPPQFGGAMLGDIGKGQQTLDPETVRKLNTLGGGAFLKNLHPPSDSQIKPKPTKEPLNIGAPIGANRFNPTQKNLLRYFGMPGFGPLSTAMGNFKSIIYPNEPQVDLNLIKPEEKHANENTDNSLSTTHTIEQNRDEGLSQNIRGDNPVPIIENEDVVLETEKLVPDLEEPSADIEGYFTDALMELNNDFNTLSKGQADNVPKLHDDFKETANAMNRIEKALRASHQRVVLSKGDSPFDSLTFDFDLDSIKPRDPLDLDDPDPRIVKLTQNTRPRSANKRHVVFVEQFRCADCGEDHRTVVLRKKLRGELAA